MKRSSPNFFDMFFFFNDTATTEIYTLSLHDALPISPDSTAHDQRARGARGDARRADHRRGASQRRLAHPHRGHGRRPHGDLDRKSTRLNSSHSQISYAVFCLKKKNVIDIQITL